MEIDVWADVVCPWCLLGKRRFEAALERFEGRDDVTVRWRSFELDPAAPREHETDAATRLAEKYGMSLEEVHQRHAQLEAMGAEEGRSSASTSCAAATRSTPTGSSSWPPTAAYRTR